MAKLSPFIMSDIDMLVNLYNSSFDIYYELYKMELDNQKDTIKFKELIEKISYLNGLASNIEERLVGSYNELKDILKYFYTKLDSNYNGDLYPIVGAILPKDRLVICRIINKLLKKLLESVPENIIDLLSLPEDIPEVTTEIKDFIAFRTLFYTYINFDISKLELAIMNGDMNKQSYEVKTALLWGCYCSGFLVEDIEEYYLKNGFNVNLHPVIIGGLAKKIYHASEEAEQLCLAEYVTEMFNRSVNNIIALEDVLISINAYAINEALYSSYIIRSLLILATPEIQQLLLSRITELISKLANKPGKKNAITILNECKSHLSTDLLIPGMSTFSR